MHSAPPAHLLVILSEAVPLVHAEDMVLVGLSVDSVAQLVAALPSDRGFFSLTLDAWEASLVLPAGDWCGLAERCPDARVAGPYRLLTFDIPLELDLVGFLAAVSTALAARDVPIYALSAVSRDHLLVRAADLAAAEEALAELRDEARRLLG